MRLNLHFKLDPIACWVLSVAGGSKNGKGEIN